MTTRYEAVTIESNIKTGEMHGRILRPELALSKREAAQYITEMLLELVNLAKSTGQKSLAGSIELAFYEAFSAANRKPVSPQELQYPRLPMDAA
jgi:hypothetical protein